MVKSLKKPRLLKKLAIVIPVFLLIISTFPRCAKIVAPTGGPKDTLAPVFVRSIPEKNSINFKGEKLMLTFNEFIKLKDAQKKIVVSPPMIKRPELLERGKNVEVRFRDSLKANTTYTLYFLDAVVDNNEGNSIKNFEFAFSTGSTIDSLTVSGKLVNAFTLLPEGDALLMLYQNYGDSVPIKEVPRYLTKTDKNGIFIFRNLQSTDYKVFALKDNNSNYKFDQVSEDIAFQKDLVRKEELKGPSLIDTSRFARRDINLSMFKEIGRIQALTGFYRDQRNKLALSFTKKPEGNVSLTPLNVKVDNNWFIKETGARQDSLIYWITDTSIYALDTLKMQVSYLKTDSLQKLQPKLDTLKLVYKEKEAPRKRRGDKEKDKEVIQKVYLSTDCSIKDGSTVKPFDPLEFIFPMPLKKFDESLMILKNLTDSSKKIELKFKKDSLNPRKYSFSHAWESDVSYLFEAFPRSFVSINGLENDTLRVKFKGTNPENFGVLIINLLDVKNTVIVELLNEKKSQVIRRIIAKPNEKVTLNFIDPGKYTLRFIEDSNSNGEWDTGWYLKGIQPEKVYYYVEGKTKGVLNIRANWENEITFSFNK